ncbi:MAG TPA: LapA family protein [Steroidobacteraceae bacterium]|nr:LapA family protein [Steroidobacteraceae bacterium]
MARRKFMMVLLLVMLLALVFTAFNPQQVSIELAFVQVHLRLGVALVIALALGLIIGIAVKGMWVTELLSERGRLRRALKAAESQVRALAEKQN